MHVYRILAALTVALGLLIWFPVFAAQNTSIGSETDSAAIKRVFTDFYESFTRHDAHATAMTFAADADFTNMRGVHRSGRKEIEAWFGALFAGNLKDAHRTDIVRSIRFFSADVATVDADTTISGTKAADGSEIPQRNGLMIATLTKQDGHWMISTFHEAEFPETRATTPDRPVRNPPNP